MNNMNQNFNFLNNPPNSSGKEETRFFGLPSLGQSQFGNQQDDQFSGFSSNLPQEFKQIFQGNNNNNQDFSPSKYSPFKPPESAKIMTDNTFKFNCLNVQEVKQQNDVDKTFLDKLEHNNINEDLICYADIEKIKKFLPAQYKGFCPLCEKFIQIKNYSEIDSDTLSAIRSIKMNKIYIIHMDCLEKGIQKLEQFDQNTTVYPMQSQDIQRLAFLNQNQNQTLTNKFIATQFSFQHPISKNKFCNLQQILPVYSETNNNQNEFINWKLQEKQIGFQSIQQIIFPFHEIHCKFSYFSSATNIKNDYSLLIDIQNNVLKEEKKQFEVKTVLSNQNKSQITFGIQLLLQTQLEEENKQFLQQQFSIDTKNLNENHLYMKICYIKFQYINNTDIIQEQVREKRYSKNGKLLPFLQSDQFGKFQSPIGTNPPGLFNNQPMNQQQQLQQQIHSPQLLSAGKPPRTQQKQQQSGVKFSSDHNLRGQQQQETTNLLYYGKEEEKDSINEIQSPNKARYSHFKDYETTSNNSLDQYQNDLSPGIQKSAFAQQGNLDDGDTKDISDIQGQILDLARTNSGSRILQRFLHHCPQESIDLILDEVYQHLPDLVIDSYGNYMFQTLIQVSTVEQRQRILTRIASQIPRIVLDKKGTHAMQTMVSMINMKLEIDLIRENIQNNIFDLSKHNNATHFLQKVIIYFDVQYLDFVYNSIIQDVVFFGNNPHCLCVLKALMSKYKKNDPQSQKIVNLLAENTDRLIQNPYGNYAIQHSFECYGEDICQGILQNILQKLTQFSIQKYSSNVIEKCVSQYSRDFKHMAIEEIIQSDTITEFMKNKYGNFILHKLLMLCQGNKSVQVLQDLIKKNINNIHIQKFKHKWSMYLEKSNYDPYLFAEGMNTPPNVSSPTYLPNNNRKNSQNLKKNKNLQQQQLYQ